MANIYTSDWHIHTEASYDGLLPFPELIKSAKEQGITEFGVTEHVNYEFMEVHLKKSRKLFEENYVEGMHFGVELTPISLYHHMHERTFQQWYNIDTKIYFGRLPDYVVPPSLVPDPLIIPFSEEKIRENKVEYVVCAAHFAYNVPETREALIENWHQQQMMCATDSRVDIVGHPWWLPWYPDNIALERFYDSNGMVTGEPWFDDFKVIPQSIHDEFAAAVKENGKCVEMNVGFFYTTIFTDHFKHQYAEYIRSLFEKGVPITIGSDSHTDYRNYQEQSEKFLAPVGFTATDFAKPKFRTYD